MHPPRRVELGLRGVPGLRGVAVLGLLILAGGCGGGKITPATPEERSPLLGVEDRSFLLDPRIGYPLVLAAETEEALAAGYAALTAHADPETARETAQQLLERDPRLHPARVLLAQVSYALGVPTEALDGLSPVVGELPAYGAAQLLRGRAAEAAGDPVAAYDSYRAVAEEYGAAAERAAGLRDEAVSRVQDRLGEDLARGRLDDAEDHLERLLDWAPEEPSTLEAAVDLASARGDRPAELEAVRQLSTLRPEDRATLERRAELELEVGRPRAGLELFEQLVEKHPGDPWLAGKLGYAKLRWRLTLLPDAVQAVAGRSELERGDVALLLYWLLPSVRYGSTNRSRIAADILDDPRREEIARVINMDLMEVDENLHHFRPTTPASRRAVLEAQLRVLARSERPVACVRDFSHQPSETLVCATAVRCGLLTRSEECLPGAPISGREALELLRRTLELLPAR